MEKSHKADTLIPELCDLKTQIKKKQYRSNFSEIVKKYQKLKNKNWKLNSFEADTGFGKMTYYNIKNDVLTIATPRLAAAICIGLNLDTQECEQFWAECFFIEDVAIIKDSLLIISKTKLSIPDKLYQMNLFLNDVEVKTLNYKF